MTRHETSRGDDDNLATSVATALRIRLGGGGLWGAHARSGHVVICHRHGDPVERHLATIIAGAVLGVVSVDGVPRSACPHH